MTLCVSPPTLPLQTAPADPEQPERDNRERPRQKPPPVPPPGAYEIPDLWSRSKKLGKQEAFQTSAARFPKKEISSGLRPSVAPGPGSYNTASSSLHANKPFAKNTGFAGSSGRFRGATTLTPGPGSYNVDVPDRGLIKRSYNVTIDGVTF